MFWTSRTSTVSMSEEQMSLVQSVLCEWKWEGEHSCKPPLLGFALHSLSDSTYNSLWLQFTLTQSQFLSLTQTWPKDQHHCECVYVRKVEEVERWKMSHALTPGLWKSHDRGKKKFDLLRETQLQVVYLSSILWPAFYSKAWIRTLMYIYS